MSARILRAGTNTARHRAALRPNPARQPGPATIRAPNAGPTAPPIVPAPIHAASAFGWRSGGTASRRSPTDAGMRKAWPAPWNNRAAMSTPTVGAKAAPAAPMIHAVSPAKYTGRRPIRSPTRPEVTTSDAMTIAYPETIHDRVVSGVSGKAS